MGWFLKTAKMLPESPFSGELQKFRSDLHDPSGCGRLAGMRRSVLAVVSPMNAARAGGIARFARERGWNLVAVDRLGGTPLAWNGDGVLATLRNDPTTVESVLRLRARGIPVVDLADTRPDIRVPRVACDNRAIGRLAAAEFAARKFRRVVWFSSGWSHVHELRWLGLSENGPAERWVLSEALPRSKGDDWNAYARWISGKLAAAGKPFAALTYEEADAARLLEAAMRAGLSVPEEVAILSVGNDPVVCENQPVPLSSIDQNIERAAYEGAELLERLMDGGSPPPGPLLVPPAGIALRRSSDAIAVSDPVVRRALDYIGRHLAEPFGAAQVKEALGIGRSALDKRFTAQLGRSIGEEIRRQRLARAKILLENTGRTIASVAAETGFCTPSHLANTFRAATGLSPRAWRKARPAAGASPASARVENRGACV